ncbi:MULTISPECIES: sulfurtransferase-like selenium metabolism protein YedF [unclassified Arcobacter]|jgi:selenium metabolism protein YedF|uniref:sulfurtransferase-like selenium metabolism protein YedF n=1 Tax=Arcobacter TaxID=28196 RepID=UPI0035D49B2D|tara:strand:- start:701 stop:1042 length:342 start_codon:yes stop_codon:yes gene_type:complete
MKTSKKTLFLKSDKVGEGELGSMLIKGFLSAIIEQENTPESIICVNSAVLLTTADEDDEIVAILKKIEEKGVKIYSCGTCLDYYNKRDDLKVGVAGNAMDTVKSLLSENIVSF